MDRQKMDGHLSWVEQRDQLGFGISKLLFLRPSAGQECRGERSRGVGPPNPEP